MEYVATQMNRLNTDVQTLGAGQQQLTGNLQSVSDTQANAQVNLIQTMEKRPMWSLKEQKVAVIAGDRCHLCWVSEFC
ncbi:MAG: hypothetical protein COC14_11755 [Burkholderiaceae bacterium]|nr:MAG: hypothetical protein COC14_11755 [Burkholderiaceae bacterium]